MQRDSAFGNSAEPSRSRRVTRGEVEVSPSGVAYSMSGLSRKSPAEVFPFSRQLKPPDDPTMPLMVITSRHRARLSTADCLRSLGRSSAKPPGTARMMPLLRIMPALRIAARILNKELHA